MKNKFPTIMSATMKNGEINRKIADKMIDPKGYFQQNKNKYFNGHTINEISFRQILKIVEQKNKHEI